MKTDYIYSIVTVIFLLSSLSMHSQTVYQWEGYTTYCSVHALLDLDTSILVGTAGGLVSINSATNQTVFLNKSTSNLPDNYIRCLEKDPSGTIWIGTNCGLTAMQGSNWIHYTPQNSIMQVPVVLALHYSTYHQALFAGLQNGNIIRIDSSGSTILIGTTLPGPQGAVYDIDVDLNGNIWASTHSYGTYRYDGSDWQIINPSSNPFYKFVTSIVVDNLGSLWVAYGSPSRLWSFDGTSWTNHNNFLNNIFFHMTVDSSNTLWISGSEGLIIYNGNNYSYHPATAILTNNRLTTHLCTKNLVIWTGTYRWGIDNIQGLTVTHYPLTPFMVSDYAVDIAFDKQGGKVWFATSWTETKTFACSYNDTVWEVLTPMNSPLTTAIITSIAVDSNSTLYLGTLNEGLWARAGNNWVHYTSSNSNLSVDAISALSIDKTGQLLIGFKGGRLQAFSNNAFITLIQDSSLKCQLNHIEPESDTVFWVATDTAGLIRCNYNSFVIFNTSNSGLPSDHIEEVRINSLNQYWISTDSGLVLFDGVNWSVYNTANSGLSYDQVMTVTIAADSAVWIGSSKGGINVFKGSSWDNYTTCDYPLCNNSVVEVATGPDGRIFICTLSGINIVKLDNIVKNPGITHASAIEIYPNPGSGIIHFNIKDLLKASVKLKVYNSLGEIVFSKQINAINQSRVDIAWDTANGSTPPGMYFYCIEGARFREAGKVIVMK